MINNENIVKAYSDHLTDKDLIRKTSLCNEYKTTLEKKILRVKYLTLDLFKEKIRKNYPGIKKTQNFLKEISKQDPIKKILKKNAIGFLFPEIYFSNPNSKKNEIIFVFPWIKNLEELVEEKGALKKEKAYHISEQIKLTNDILFSQNIKIKNLNPRDIYILKNKIFFSNVESKKYEIESFEEIGDTWELSKWPTNDLILEMMLGKYKDGIPIFGVKQEKKQEKKKQEKPIEKKILKKKLRGIHVDEIAGLQLGHASIRHSAKDYQTQNAFEKDEKEIEELFDETSTNKNGKYKTSIIKTEEGKNQKIEEEKLEKVEKKKTKKKVDGGNIIDMIEKHNDPSYVRETIPEEYKKEEQEQKLTPIMKKEYEKDKDEKRIEIDVKEGSLEKKVKEGKTKTVEKEKQKEGKKSIYEESLMIPGRVSIRNVSEANAIKKALLYLNGPVNKYGESEEGGAIDKAIKIFRKKHKKLFERKEREGKGRILEIDGREEVKKHIKFPRRKKGDYRNFMYVGKIKVLEIDLKNNNY